ncbi:MAG: GNAT family N-acetyltransferase [Bacteroidota bacterium]|jgi:L-amino acid N-acyltransferase YncA
MRLEFKFATPEDLEQITCTYNAAIAFGGITADTTAQSVNSRLIWYNQHIESQLPVWTIYCNKNYCGWMSLSAFYGRPAYLGCKEVSIYLNPEFYNQGIGTHALLELIKYAQAHNLHTLLAFIFSKNLNSIHLFAKLGFKPWGILPEIADVKNYFENLEIWGLKL